MFQQQQSGSNLLYKHTQIHQLDFYIHGICWTDTHQHLEIMMYVEGEREREREREILAQSMYG